MVTITLKTTNSLGSDTIFARISGKFDYPIKYTDPDGRHDEKVIALTFNKNIFGIIGNFKAWDIHGNKSMGIFTVNDVTDIFNENSNGIGMFLYNNNEIKSGVIVLFNTDILDAINGDIIPGINVNKPSDLLRKNLLRQGEIAQRGDQAHHIVPFADPRAKASWHVLRDYGIDINHAENGVFLSENNHRKTFSPEYINRVNNIIGAASNTGSRSAVLEALKYIKDNLKQGNFDF
jgi:hypothetical protein